MPERAGPSETADILTRLADHLPEVGAEIGLDDEVGHNELAPEVERRRRPSDALFIDFLMQELRDANDRTADVEALLARAAWRLVS